MVSPFEVGNGLHRSWAQDDSVAQIDHDDLVGVPPRSRRSSSGLDQLSFLMVDKVTTMPRGNLRDHLGRLGDKQVVQLKRALIVFFGLAEAAPGS